MTSLIIPGASARPRLAEVPPPSPEPLPGPTVRWSAILMGALLTITVQIPLMMIGAGIGLATLDVRRPEVDVGLTIAGSVFAALTLVAAFAAGGWVAAYFARPDRRGSAVLHGLATWAVVAAAGVLLVGTQMVSAMGGLFQAAGVGVASAAGADTALDQLARMDMKIVSDFDLVEGKVVSRIVASKPPVPPSEEAVAEAKEKASKLAPSRNKETRQIAEGARDASAIASFVAAGALLLSAFAAVGGALVGRPRHA